MATKRKSIANTVSKRKPGVKRMVKVQERPATWVLADSSRSDKEVIANFKYHSETFVKNGVNVKKADLNK